MRHPCAQILAARIPSLRRRGIAALLLGIATINTVQADAPLLDGEQAVVKVFDLAAERLALMPQIAAAKWLSKAPIADPAREQVVLDDIAQRADRIGLQPQAVRTYLASQITIARHLQQNLHVDWQRGECVPCRAAPDLVPVRASLDRISNELVTALYIAAPEFARADFIEHYRPVANARWLQPAGAMSQVDVEGLLADLARIGRHQPPGLARARASGVLRIGTTGDYAPFSLESEGKVGGADIELGTALAAHLGLQPVFVRTRWSTLVDDLRADRYDIAASGVTITAERSRIGEYSRPYHSGGKTIIARCTDRQRLASLQSLDRPSVRMIVNAGGTNERFARDNLRNAQLRVLADNRQVFDEIVAGRADAMITDDVEVQLQTHRKPVLCRAYPGTLTRAWKALFLVRDPPLKEAVDAWLLSVDRDGQIDRWLQAALDK